MKTPNVIMHLGQQVFGKEEITMNKDVPIKKIIVGIHGIKSHRENWIDRFIPFCKTFFHDENVLYVDYQYGYLPGIISIIPFVKKKLVKRFRNRLQELQKQFPEASLNIIGHSYGTEKTHLALKTSANDGKGIIIADKIILVASILNIKTDLSKMFARGQFKEFHVYSSLEDEVCQYNPFGHSGYVGLYDDFAINHRYAELEHGGYFTADFFRQWAEIFELKEREL